MVSGPLVLDSFWKVTKGIPQLGLYLGDREGVKEGRDEADLRKRVS